MANLDLTQFLGSTSQPVGTVLAYQINGSVVPGSKAVFKTISTSSLVLEGQFAIEGLKVMDGDLEIRLNFWTSTYFGPNLASVGLSDR